MYSRKLAQIYTKAIVTSAGAYSANDQVGVAVEIPIAEDDAGYIELRSLVLIDYDTQKISTDLFFFDKAPVNAVADNGVASIADADMLDACLGVVNVPAANYSDTAANSVATVKNIGLILKAGKTGSKSIWVLVVTRGTPTYASTTSLKLKLGVEKF